jgi:hypothetical protein
MGCYGWENGYLSSWENANLLQYCVSKLVFSTPGEMLMWLPGNLKIDSQESKQGATVAFIGNAFILIWGADQYAMETDNWE